MKKFFIGFIIIMMITLIANLYMFDFNLGIEDKSNLKYVIGVCASIIGILTSFVITKINEINNKVKG